MNYKFKEILTGKIYDGYDLAVKLYDEPGNTVIAFCCADIECIAKGNNDEYYILDECGSYLWVDPERFEATEEEND